MKKFIVLIIVMFWGVASGGVMQIPRNGAGSFSKDSIGETRRIIKIREDKIEAIRIKKELIEIPSVPKEQSETIGIDETLDIGR